LSPVITEDLLTGVAKLPKGQRAKVMALLGKQEFERCAADPLYWLDASKHVRGLPYVYTHDPHKVYTCCTCQWEVYEERRVDHMEIVHGQKANNLHSLAKDFEILPAIRPFSLMEYMPPMIRAWQTAQYFVCEKSRDMMVTWLMVTLFTWDAMFNAGRQHIFQSEDAFKTYELVKRAHLIYKMTPAFLRNAIGHGIFSKGSTKSGELFFPEQNSEILGLPQGPDQVRQFHPSGIFSDEAAFQIEAGATFAAIKPAILMGGRYTAISSANRSWFELVCRDRTDD
jgi:hypothetical protein